MREKSFSRGVTMTLLGAVAWGFSGACFQFLFSSYDASPLMLCTIRMLGAGATFLAVLLARSRTLVRDMLSDATSRRSLLIFGVFGLFANQMLYTTTITFTNAGTATVLQTLNAAIILAWTCLRTPRLPQTGEIAALICALAATWLIATGGSARSLSIPPAGLAFGLATAVVAAFYISYPKALFMRWGAFATTGIGMLVGGIVALGFLICTGGAQAGLGPHDFKGLLAILVIVLVGSFGAYALYLGGVAIVGNINGSMLGAVEPVSATLFSSLWLGTSFGWTDWAGLVLMVTCVVLIARQGLSSPNTTSVQSAQ